MPQTSFGNPTGGSLYNPVVQQQPVATFGGQTTGGFPQTSFGQPQQNGFSPFGQQQQQQPPQLQQATTFSLLPVQQQPTFTLVPQQPAFNQFAQQPQQTGGRRANLSAATPDNPFGF